VEEEDGDGEQLDIGRTSFKGRDKCRLVPI